ncbi:MAG: VOC family protein [Solirubrobacteraceae bacterium]|jgi:predicted enzyme related to lactoylglutathione lyase
MGERSGYAPGTFSWVDLSTTDQDAAKTFYTGLFGWQIEDMPAGEGAVYSMASVDSKHVAAIGPQPAQQREAGVPPMWNSYVTVADADASAARAKELGATVHAPPFDVMTAGRMAVIQDPQGAFFEIWQPGDRFGAALVNAPGAFSWNELSSPDVDASAAFYGELFGWTITPVEGMPMAYLTIRNGETNNGGITEPAAPGTPPYWLVYFAVDDIDAGLAKVAELGGAKIAGPIDIGVAKIAVVSDPQGAVFALYAGQLEP